ncbi:MATE family efflux transporter [Aquimarina rhabdastrellae]
MSTNISFKSINKLAIPAIIAGIAEPVLSSTDAAIVGNIPEEGTTALAAVGVVGSFLSMLIWVLGQTRSAISSIVAQYLGAGKVEEIKSLPIQVIFLNVIFSIVVLLSTYFFTTEIFNFFNATGDVLAYSIRYYEIRVWGFPLTLFTFAIFGIFRGLQNTFWPMIVATIGAIVNIVLDVVLVYGITDILPAMGIDGAAYASLTSQLIMAILALILVLKKTKISFNLGRKIHPEIKRLVLMSFNLIIRTIALNIALIVAVREATAIGKEFIAAHAIAINIWFFTAFFLDGYGAAGNALSGRLLGNKDYKGLWLLSKRITKYNLIVSGILILIGLITYKQIGLIFNKDETVLNIFYTMFYLVLISQPLNAIAFSYDAMFKGLGEMKALRNVLLIATFLGFLPMVYIAKYFELKLFGIWIAILLWLFIRGVLLILKFRKKYYPLVMQEA